MTNMEEFPQEHFSEEMVPEHNEGGALENVAVPVILLAANELNKKKGGGLEQMAGPAVLLVLNEANKKKSFFKGIGGKKDKPKMGGNVIGQLIVPGALLAAHKYTQKKNISSKGGKKSGKKSCKKGDKKCDKKGGKKGASKTRKNCDKKK